MPASEDLRLTRRDAVAALTAVGAAAGAGAAFLALDDETDKAAADGALDAEHEATMVAAAEVLYPSAVDGVAGFVRRYLAGVTGSEPSRTGAIADAADYLDGYARSWHDAAFASLSVERRDRALRAMGADTAEPAPAGSPVERVRYHVVDELLYALYSTPTGGELVGTENPPGHPGGTASYRREP